VGAKRRCCCCCFCCCCCKQTWTPSSQQLGSPRQGGSRGSGCPDCRSRLGRRADSQPRPDCREAFVAHVASGHRWQKNNVVPLSPRGGSPNLCSLGKLQRVNYSKYLAKVPSDVGRVNDSELHQVRVWVNQVQRSPCNQRAGALRARPRLNHAVKPPHSARSVRYNGE